MVLISEANTRQVGGDHYKTEYQHWDYLNDMMAPTAYFAGQISKYVSRARKKNGVRDVEKAKHFAVKFRELALDDRSVMGHLDKSDASQTMLERCTRFAVANDLSSIEASICAQVMFVTKVEHIDRIIDCIDKLLDELRPHDKGADKELPVSQDFEFVSYTSNPLEGDSETSVMDSIIWRHKATGELVTLGIDEPPKLHLP